MPTATGPLLRSYSRIIPQHLTIVVTNVTIRVMEEPRVIHSIKIKLTILRKGKVAAVTSDKTLGQWLEEAIMEKIERERNLIKEV